VQAGINNGYTLKVVNLPLLARVAWKRLQIGRDMLLIITSNNNKFFIGVNIDDLEWFWTPKIEVLVFFRNLWLWRRFQEWIASKWIEIDQDNLRIAPAKAVARFMNFAQITCCTLPEQVKESPVVPGWWLHLCSRASCYVWIFSRF